MVLENTLNNETSLEFQYDGEPSVAYNSYDTGTLKSRNFKKQNIFGIKQC